MCIRDSFKIEQVVLFNMFGKTIDEIGSNIKILTNEEIEEHTNRFYMHLFDFQTGVKKFY